MQGLAGSRCAISTSSNDFGQLRTPLGDVERDLCKAKDPKLT